MSVLHVLIFYIISQNFLGANSVVRSRVCNAGWARDGLRKSVVQGREPAQPFCGEFRFFFFFRSEFSACTIRPEINSNDFGVFSGINLQIRIRFCRCGFFLNDWKFWCVQSSISCNETVHVHVLWHFECCGVLDDSR